jgi:hypothetical protein
VHGLDRETLKIMATGVTMESGSTAGMMNIPEIWATFLIETELARNVKKAHYLSGLRSPAPDPIGDRIIPSLLYLRLGSILAEAFEEYIDNNGLTMTKPYRNDLNGRICFLADQGRLGDPSKVHDLRRRRNELAHEATRSCDWSEVDAAIDVAQSELQHLGFVGPRPQFEFYGNRSPRTGEPFAFDYCYGLKSNGEKVVEVTWATQTSFPLPSRETSKIRPRGTSGDGDSVRSSIDPASRRWKG